MKYLFIYIAILNLILKKTQQKDASQSSQFLLKQISGHQSLLKSVQNYIDPFKKIENDQYTWQQSIFQIKPNNLRDLIYNITLNVPIPQWPQMIKTLIFPQIYGFETDNDFKTQFEQNQKNLLSGYQQILQTKYNEIDGEDKKQLNLMEKISNLMVLKQVIDKDIQKGISLQKENNDMQKKVNDIIQQTLLDQKQGL